MCMECTWCGNEIPPEEDGSDEEGHCICLNCIDDALCKMGEEAEHNAWLLAFKIERLYSKPPEEKGRGESRQDRGKPSIEDCMPFTQFH